MEARKRRKKNAEPPSAIEWTLPMELLLEITACSDTRTLVRAAASCKLLRREILSPHFIRRVTQQGGIVPPWILAYLNTHLDKAGPPPSLSLIHPAAPVATSFLGDYLSPYMSRCADDLLMEYYPVLSPGGLIVLRRRRFSNILPNLCVYDPITGHRTFLSYPPSIYQENTNRFSESCILLTAADGIDCSFLLFFPHRWVDISYTSTIDVHIATSKCCTWTPAAMSDNISHLFLQMWFVVQRDAVILHGGVIHWLLRYHGVIVTYNACTTEYATRTPPGPITNFKGQLYLGSHDGQKLLCLLGTNGFNISVWHQLPSGDWPPVAVTIDTEVNLRSLYPEIRLGGPFVTILQSAGMGSSVVLRRRYQYGPSIGVRALLFVFDLDTMEMRVYPDSTPSSIVLEVDLPSRLRAMKIFF